MRLIKSNNRGLSLIELIIVIAIIAVMTGVAGLSISLAFSRDAENGARMIDRELEQVRMNAMTKSGTHTLAINRTTNEISLFSVVNGTKTVIDTDDLPAQVTVSFFQDDGSELTGVNELFVTFDKSTGKVARDGIQDQSGTNYDKSLFRIRVASQNNKVATIILIRNTGKHYVEYGG